MKTIHLRAGKERALWKRHPWIFSGAIQDADSLKNTAGETVRVESHDSKFLAYAAFSPSSQIRARVWSFDEAAIIDHRFFKNAVRAAAARRAALPINATAHRAVHGESDGLPGLIVDVYNNVAVAQFTSAGTERWKDAITQALLAELKVSAVYERSDSSVRKLEGLAPTQGWLHGEAAVVQQFTENDIRFEVDIATGHKTGFYLDQRDSRALFARIVRDAQLKRVLNCYCYTGGFSLAALKGDATEVVSVDSSAPALAQAARHVALNGFDPSCASFVDADVNATLRRLRAEEQQFDAIVLDPPKFAPSAAHAERASRAYKDINRLAFYLLRPGGFLFTFSCSGGISADMFEGILGNAASEAHADAAIIARTGAGHDHPHRLAFPEGEYLKGLLLQKI
jgi:23S rRNA (cytosine1962-C5)-methyltransferase